MLPILVLDAGNSRLKWGLYASPRWQSFGATPNAEIGTLALRDWQNLARPARIVGVNNRNLRTLAVDLDVSEELIARIPQGVTTVSESGIKTPEDIARFRRLGYHAFLIGERFMVCGDPGTELGALLRAAGG